MDSLARAPRLHTDESISFQSPVSLSRDQSHYLRRVMRMSDGDMVKLFNGMDGEWTAVLSLSVGKRDVLTPRTRLKEQNEGPDLWLCCAPIKRAHFEFTLQKATELGVRSIFPILTERTQVRDVNLERARAIAVEAAEQSERLSIPSIEPVRSLENFLKSLPSDRKLLVCAEWGDAAPLSEILAALKEQKSKCAIVVGPEGGFSAIEFALLRTLPGAVFARMGPRILRADTAALAAIACWQAICGDW